MPLPNGQHAYRTNSRCQPHRKIKTKVNTRSYDTLEVFDQDVRATFLQEPLPSAAATSNNLGDDVGKTKTNGNSSESGPIAEEGVGGEPAIAKKRKEALTAEFVARLEIDRANVERVIRARDKRSRLT